MSDFLDSIKVTKEDKKTAISKVVFNMIHSINVLSFNEVLESNNGIKEKLSQNELLATYSLAKEIRISMIASANRNKKLFDYLELKTTSINEENLLKFVDEIVKDIEFTQKRAPKTKWDLQVGKIFLRLEGKNPYSEEDFIQEETDNSDIKNKIIEFKTQ